MGSDQSFPSIYKEGKMALLTINGVALKTPSEFNVTVSDIDYNTTRNAKGDLIRDRIGVKRKLDLSFPPMTQTELTTLLNATSAVFFNVTYQDPILGMTTKEMYVGDRKMPLYRYGNGTTDLLWEGLSMNFIER
jgi:hypothetical protein